MHRRFKAKESIGGTRNDCHTILEYTAAVEVEKAFLRHHKENKVAEELSLGGRFRQGLQESLRLPCNRHCCSHASLFGIPGKAGFASCSHPEQPCIICQPLFGDSPRPLS